MFCIAVFIIFAILGIFSARYRKLAAQAWECVAKRVTFRSCDVNFGDQVKGQLLGKLVLSHPFWYRFFKKWFDLLAFIFVALSIWSVLYLAVAGMNYLAYDTCKPQNAESCSLAGQACSISQSQPGFIASLKDGKILQWAETDWKDFDTTLSILPSRFKDWKPQEYITADNTYLDPFNPSEPAALEIVDPGCKYCALLFNNIEQAGFAQKYNLTYVVYPIPDPSSSSGYKFANSYLLASYLEAMKQVRPANPKSQVPPDWQTLKEIYTSPTLQSQLDYSFSAQDAQKWADAFMLSIGYTQNQVTQIDALRTSDQVKQELSRQANIVEKQVRTVKIPTIMFGGRLYERVIGTDKLK